MAITTSAKKALRASKRKKIFNDRRKRAMRGAIKNMKTAATAQSLAEAYKAIDKAAKRGVIKKNAAARRKRQVAKLLKA
jgi:small subunit ribosomal protein S20